MLCSFSGWVPSFLPASLSLRSLRSGRGRLPPASSVRATPPRADPWTTRRTSETPNYGSTTCKVRLLCLSSPRQGNRRFALRPNAGASGLKRVAPVTKQRRCAGPRDVFVWQNKLFFFPSQGLHGTWTILQWSKSIRVDHQVTAQAAGWVTRLFLFVFSLWLVRTVETWSWEVGKRQTWIYWCNLDAVWWGTLWSVSQFMGLKKFDKERPRFRVECQSCWRRPQTSWESRVCFSASTTNTAEGMNIQMFI